MGITPSQTRLLVFALSVAMLFLSACGGSAPSANTKTTVAPVATSPNSSDKSGYLYVDPTGNGETFLQFTEQNALISGTGTSANITNPQGMEDVTPQTFTLAGSHTGDTISLTFSSGFTSKTYTGTFKDNTLTLSATQQDGSIENVAFHPASIDDYNQALANTKQRVQDHNQTYTNTQNALATVQAQGTAQANQQDAVQNDNDGLASNLNALKTASAALSQLSYTGVLNGYASVWAQMQKDYAREQADAAKGCGDGGSNLGTVQSEDGTVQSDEGSIQSEDGSLESVKGSYDATLSPVEDDIKNVKGWWTQLQTDAAKNTTGTPAPAYTADQVNQAIADAQGIEKTALGTWNSARSTAQGYDAEAADLLKKANAIPASMHC